MLIGNLSADAEVKSFGQGDSSSVCANFTVVTSEKYKDRNNEVKEEREFHECQMWNRPNLHQYLVKGQQVYIEGQIKTESWTDQQNQKRYTKRVKVTGLHLLGSRPQGASAQQAVPQTQQQMPPQQQTYVQPQYQQAAPQYQPQPQVSRPAPAPQYQQTPPQQQMFNPLEGVQPQQQPYYPPQQGNTSFPMSQRVEEGQDDLPF